MYIIMWGVLLLNNPYLMAGFFFQLLLLLTIIVRSYSKFIGCILFLVYVGGIMILTRYCVILIPINKFSKAPITLLIFIGFALRVSQTPVGVYTYGLLYRASVVFLMVRLLYLVMLSIVEIIDYSRGIIKIYDKLVRLCINK